MEITFGVLIFCIVAFFVAGFIDSIAGGAGFVTAPSLLLIGMPPHMALGTGKLATSIGSVVALWTFWRSNLILDVYKRQARRFSLEGPCCRSI